MTISKQINELLIKTTETHTTVNDMKKRLFGNGQPGDIGKMEIELNNIHEKLNIHDSKIKSLEVLNKNIKYATGAFVLFVTTNIGLFIKILKG